MRARGFENLALLSHPGDSSLSRSFTGDWRRFYRAFGRILDTSARPWGQLLSIVREV